MHEPFMPVLALWLMPQTCHQTKSGASTFKNVREQWNVYFNSKDRTSPNLIPLAAMLPFSLVAGSDHAVADTLGLCICAESSGGSLWDTSVAAAQARGETVSLYTPPAQTPQAAEPFTGFGLKQRPAPARPMADSFLQIDRYPACL